MQRVSIGLGRTIVVIAGTFVCGSSLMFAALGPGLAQAQPNQVAAAQRA